MNDGMVQSYLIQMTADGILDFSLSHYTINSHHAVLKQTFYSTTEKIWIRGERCLLQRDFTNCAYCYIHAKIRNVNDTIAAD